MRLIKSKDKTYYLLNFILTASKIAFGIFSIWYNVKFYYRLLYPKMVLEPLNCGSFLDKIYLWLHENVLEISLKIVFEKI